MIRATFALCAALIVSPAYAIEIQPVISPGGIQAWLVEDHSIPFVAVSLAFMGGASLDAPDKRGAVNLMAATLEEGAGELDATAFAQAVESLGAQFSFAAGDDALSVDLRALTENRDETAALLAQALTQPRFDADAVDRVRAQVQAVIRSEDTNPNALAAKEMARQAWGDHPYATSVNGTADSLAALRQADLIEAKNRVLARDRMVIGAAGDITPDELGKMLDSILGGLPEQGTAPLPDPATLDLTGGVTVIDWDSPQTVVSFAGPGLPIDDPDYFAAFVANHILGGGGFSSRLMDEIREKRGLTYGIGTSLSTGIYGQTWGGGSAIANANVGQAVGLIRAEWDRLAEGVTDQELADAKTYLTGEYPLRFDGNGKIAGILTGMQMVGFPIDYPNTRNAKVEAVTVADVQRVAQRLLDADGLRFVLVGKPEGIGEDGSVQPAQDQAAN
ncbi:MAG: pitrilysin family protein [Paracoccus sp. (in: a-proteobacteria)]|uniref:M16 family metallopeptidase n=1 Tax=Paracoccus sp. TaxID=267 RepID=UPI0026E084D5|nr:pitrilysin family protein [Paracoccus sp. (in: a-proteobacteria)]MDO5631177.1 pitrilysin family protein [Paracoccus sp. (in: a-proteobacteria)]